MPPTRGRGRGRGRWANHGITRGASKAAKSSSTPRSIRTRRTSQENMYKVSPNRVSRNPHHHGLSTQGIHAVVEPPALLIIAGLQPEHFPDYESDVETESDSHSDYFSGKQSKTRRLLGTTNGAQQGSEDHDDWTETDVEVFVESKTRGFYRPPPRRDVVRRRVRKAESSRYNSAVPKVIRYPADSNEGSDQGSHGQVSHSLLDQGPVHGEESVPTIEIDPARDQDNEDQEMEDVPPLEHEDDIEEEQAPPVEVIDEGELSDSNFLDPFLPRLKDLKEESCEDEADYIMKTRFAPMADPQKFIHALTKLDPASRSMDVLFDIAFNAQRALKAWQDEYIELDLRTAPASNPPKKPLNGGRVPVDPEIYEDMLEADLYGYIFDAKKGPGQQDPFRQRAAGKHSRGRELRHRRTRDVGQGEASDAEVTGTEGYGTRRRRAAQQQSTELQVPPRATLKRVHSFGTPDVDGGPPRKRGRPSAAEKAALQTRIQQLREESAMTTGSEGDNRSPERQKRRGRPPGSKNTQPRSDAGIKKGPRKTKMASFQGDSEGASQNGTLERMDEHTPHSHLTPSMDERMATDEEVKPAVHHPPPYPPQLHSQYMMHMPAEDDNHPRLYMKHSDPSGGDYVLIPPTPQKDKDPKKRVRSEKRSKSMTEWWAARKAKAAEDRKMRIAQQAEADRVAEEQARAAHQAHQAQYPPHDSRYWPQIAPQHRTGGPPSLASHGYMSRPPQSPSAIPPMPPPIPPKVFGRQPKPSKRSQDRRPQAPPASRPLNQSQNSQHAAPNQSPHHPQTHPPNHLLNHPQGHVRHHPQNHSRDYTQNQPSNYPQGPASSAPPLPALPQHLPPGPPPIPQGHPQGDSRGHARGNSQGHIHIHPQGPCQGHPQQAHPYPPPPQMQGPPPPQQHYQPPPPNHLHGPPPPPSHSHGPPLPPDQSHGPLAPANQYHGPPPPLSFGPPPPPPPPPQILSARSPPQHTVQHVFHQQLPPQSYSPQLQQPPPLRQSSPLRRINNYVSDPSAAAQPSGPPYQTIMTPGGSAVSQTHQNHPPPPNTRARTPTSAGSFMGAFHVNHHRQSIPGTGSFRPSTPVIHHHKSNSFAPPPRGGPRLTGGQVQDLALVPPQPVQRRPMREVIEEQQAYRSMNATSPPPSNVPERRQLYKLQPAPPPAPAPGRTRSPPPPLHAHGHQDQPPTNYGPPPSRHQQHEYDAPPPPPHIPHHLHHPSLPALAPAKSERQPAGPPLKIIAQGIGPPLAPAPPYSASATVYPHEQRYEARPETPGSAGSGPAGGGGGGGGGRNRSVSTSSHHGGGLPPPQHLQQQMRFVEMHGDGRRGSRGKS